MKTETYTISIIEDEFRFTGTVKEFPNISNESLSRREAMELVVDGICTLKDIEDLNLQPQAYYIVLDGEKIYENDPLFDRALAVIAARRVHNN